MDKAKDLHVGSADVMGQILFLEGVLADDNGFDTTMAELLRRNKVLTLK